MTKPLRFRCKSQSPKCGLYLRKNITAVIINSRNFLLHARRGSFNSVGRSSWEFLVPDPFSLRYFLTWCAKLFFLIHISGSLLCCCSRGVTMTPARLKFLGLFFFWAIDMSFMPGVHVKELKRERKVFFIGMRFVLKLWKIFLCF